MTLDEALIELGVDKEADAESARRAYLRLLKKRKPEVDREGFMRLREAYEIAKPYFERADMFRALEKAATTEAPIADDSPQRLRIETPGGIVWIQNNRPVEVNPDEPVTQDKPTVSEEKPLVEEDKPVVDAPSEPAEKAIEPEVVPAQPEILVATPKPEEPSIKELIAAGKFKKAARRLTQHYQNAQRDGSIDYSQASPHQTIQLLFRLHDKNHLTEARDLEKEFAAWLSSTGMAVRLMAGPIGVMWLIARELSALSPKFPTELRSGIAKAAIAGKLEDAERRADYYQSSDPSAARNAALELHAHAPTLARMLGDTLAPPERRAASASSGRGGTWGIGFVLVMMLNFLRVCGNQYHDATTEYRGQADPNSFYRPNIPPTTKPASNDSPLKVIDNGQMIDPPKYDQLLKQAQKIETKAGQTTLDNERWVLQRARYILAAIETHSCDRTATELNSFYADVPKFTKRMHNWIAPDVISLDKLFRQACGESSLQNLSLDGGLLKP